MEDIFKKNSFPFNQKNKADGIELLSSIKDNSIKAIFFDPQYRGVLDKLKYGNEGKNRGKARSELPQMDYNTIIAFLAEIERVLKRSGYLFLWVDKFHLVEGVSKWFQSLKSLSCVDMITWDKGKIGMGYRTRRKAEYLVVVQKAPVVAKSTWTIHNIPDVWLEKLKQKNHTHAKPIELQKILIQATTTEQDYVCDPASGGYSVLKACLETNRNFIGCDIEFGEQGENK